jgi:hypothetical protein
VSRIAPPRIEWVDRQVLAGGDLRGAERFLDAHRARHVRGAHHTWGVAVGLDVTRTRSPEGFVVAPGLAYDARGRELLVGQPLAVPATALQLAAGDLTIAIRSRGDDAVPDVDVRVVSDREPLALGRDVPLCTFAAGPGAEDTLRRPHVARLVFSRVRAGHVAAGSIAATVDGDCLVATVDTTAAGFSVTPVYLVQPLLSATPPPPGLLLLALRTERNSVPTPTGFDVELRYGASTQAMAAKLPLAAGGMPVGFTWIGYEPPLVFGAAPAPDAPCPRLL